MTIRGILAVVACVAALHLFVLETDKDSPGVMTRVTKPIVHRSWKNLSTFPVSRTMWENLGFTVYDYNDTAAFAIVARNGYGREWRQLTSFAAKTDLFRYVILYEQGGWWADADMVPKSGIRMLGLTRSMVLFHEACGYLWFNRVKFACGLSTVTHAPQYKNSLLAMPAKSPILLTALQLLRLRVADHGGQRWSVVNVIDTTGPGLLTAAVELHPGEVRQGAIVGCKSQYRYMHHLGLRTWHN